MLCLIIGIPDISISHVFYFVSIVQTILFHNFAYQLLLFHAHNCTEYALGKFQ